MRVSSLSIRVVELNDVDLTRHAPSPTNLFVHHPLQLLGEARSVLKFAPPIWADGVRPAVENTE